MNDYNFGNFVCMLREKKGLTQADIAEQLGVTAAAVSKWENGSSKPRVEVLFKLAEILGVRPEELMAGHYIEGSELDPEAVKNINERYEYLRRIDAYNTTETKIRRLAAALCDWLIIGGAELLILMVFVFAFFDRIEANDQGIALLMMPIMLAYPLIFVTRQGADGKDKVCQIITFGTLSAKAAIKAVARVMELPFEISNKVSQFVPAEVGMTIDKALEVSPDFKKVYDEDALENALKQIDDKNYKQNLIDIGICEDQIVNYGFAFEGKKVLVGKNRV